ncbi:hypothetical protein JOC73_000554 [Alkaliphilus hydrothermalis]|uniref:DUF2953 domain-containing protein n=1 Tax=Alkaliphilus hydrothermalis TaxID=1482730 RepID=A0ABS2NM68_9FIRM|nr:hypothetical protein [Alkaliphilus hydrothermalis]
MILFFYYLFAALFLLFVLLLFSEISIGILVLKNNQREEIVINTRAFYGLLKYRMELPFLQIFKKGNALNDLQVNSDIEVSNQEMIKDQKEKNFSLDEIQKIYRRVRIIYKRYRSIIIYVHRRTVFDEIKWETEIGTGDAAATAVTTGFFWMLKSNVITFMGRKVELKEVAVNVVPCYQGEKFNTSFNCIFTLKFGYIIIAALKMLYRKIKGW